YIADTGNHVIRKVDTKGNISTIAGVPGTLGAAGDNGPATGANLNRPAAVAVDSFGNVFIADTGNSEIRKVAGVNITCVLGCGGSSGTIDNPDSIVVDANGNLFITDTGKYRVVEYSGSALSVLAGTAKSGFSGDGGKATSATFNNPQGIAMDSAGFLYIADSFNNRIRKLLKDGTIITIAGNGAFSSTGDGGPATSAGLYFPRGVIVDGKGNVYVADTANAAIRKLTPSAPAI